MVAQFPSSSSTSTSTNTDKRLTPGIDFLITTTDLSSQGTDPLDPKLTVTRYARVAKVQIQVTGIEVGLIEGAITRIFDNVNSAILENINGDYSTSPTIKSGSSNLLFTADLQMSVKVDRSSRIPTVDLSLMVDKLKSSYVAETLSRIKGYLTNAIRSDINPH
jgi:hypothetical protein